MNVKLKAVHYDMVPLEPSPLPKEATSSDIVKSTVNALLKQRWHEKARKAAQFAEDQETAESLGMSVFEYRAKVIGGRFSVYADGNRYDFEVDYR